MSVHVATPAHTAVDLAFVLERVAASARAFARGRRVRLSVEVETGPLLVPGSWTAVQDAILDVAGRAVAACGSGTEVVLDVHREAGGYAVDVTDTGPGIDRPDSLTVREVLESVGGRLHVAHVEGVGSTSRLWWPEAPVAASPADPARNGRAAAAV